MSLEVPEASFQNSNSSRGSQRLSQLLANTLMVGQYMEFNQEKDGLIQVPFEHRKATVEEKIDTRIHLLNQELELEINRLRFSEDSKKNNKPTSWTNQIRNSLFPKPKTMEINHQDLEKQITKQSRRKFNLKCLMLMVITILLLIIFLTLTLVFTINKAYPDPKFTSSLLDKDNLNQSLEKGMDGILPPTENCKLVLKCFNSGELVMFNGNCICLCPKDLKGLDCRTLIKP